MDNQIGIKLLNKLRIKYFWIYITEKCNLNCKYCFYKFRSGRNNIDFRNIQIIFDYFSNARHSEFVISGGEPLLEWDLVIKVVDYIRAKFNKFIILQTNGILLDSDKIKFIKDKNIGLELGLDGGLSTTAKYRIGASNYFNKIINNIAIAKANKIKIFATMTVHPEESHRLFENYKYLIDSGIEKVEITPAAFEKWDKSNTDNFKDGYQKVIQYSINQGNMKSISVEYDRPLKQPVFDLIILPTNNIVTNWALLSLPDKLKAKYTFLNIKNKKIHFNAGFKTLFIKYIDAFNSNNNITYRDLSNINARLVYNEFFKKNESFFNNYSDIGCFLKNINQKVMLINEKNSTFGK